MPPSPRIGRAPARSGPGGAGPVVAALAAVVLFAVTVVGTLYLQHLGDNGVRAERELLGIRVELQIQDALLSRVVSGRETVAQIRPEIDQSRAQAETLIAAAGDGSLSSSGEYLISSVNEDYSQAVDLELGLLAAGRPQDAAEIDSSDVAQSFAAAGAAVTSYADQVATAAERAGAFSDVGLLLIGGLAILIIAVMQGRRRLSDDRQQYVRHSEARYRALVNQSADIVMVTDRDGFPTYLSPAAERLFRLTDRPMTSHDLVSAIHPDDRETMAATLASVDPDRGLATVELRIANGARESGWRHFEVSIQDLFSDPAVRGLVLTGHDVTDRRSLQREVEHRALHDSLTGLPNRALLSDRLGQSLRIAHRQGTTAALLLIDLDRFKEVNDTLGHHYGDQLLAQIGPRLAEGLRKMDTVARLGGDEFAVLLPSVRDLQGATEVAHKLQAALSRPFQVEGVQLDVEASIGVVVSGDHGDDASTLIQRADIAMYVAKQRNLGVSTYDREVDSNTPERLAMLGDLRRALHDDELFLHFQPKVDLSTGQVCGAEALLRWQHPERGLIPPDDFIPLAENTGMIGPLTSRVLNLALVQIRLWADGGVPVPVAINLSARNLLDEQLDEQVADALARHGVGAHLLKLEVTESAIMTDPVRAVAVLQRLADQGISISIDDFGAGYTSMRQLKDLPISELKVDRSFVTDMETDPSNAVIVRSVIDLGHNLGLSIVAEGVETPLSLDRLRSYGCDIAQGYFLARPMSAGAFDEWRKAWPGLPHPNPIPTPRVAAPSRTSPVS
jgi:diguanylate cyclase (GGDEF)-like protein/PAS domain S-box-containing protein